MALWHLIFAILPNFIQVNHVVLLFTKFLYRLKRNRSWLRNDEKNSWNFVCVQAKQCKTPFILTRFFSFFEKCHKFRETLFTFKQNSAELLSFWRDFFSILKNFKTLFTTSILKILTHHITVTWSCKRIWNTILFKVQVSTFKRQNCLLPLEIFSIVFPVLKGAEEETICTGNRRLSLKLSFLCLDEFIQA